jgi:hypothetical protein
VAFVAVALVSVAILAGALASRHSTGMSMATGPVAAGSASGHSESSTAPGSPARFAYLTSQHSNNCALQMQALTGYRDETHLQGSCCTAMDINHYQAQAAALRQYQSEVLIPSDPYDISVALAKQLTHYEQVLTLSTEQQQTYTLAMQASAEKGPCCCHCWRWDAFAGLSKYLISRQHMAASTLGKLIEDLDGCGGRA